MKHRNNPRQYLYYRHTGFSLIELAIVLMVLAVALSYVVPKQSAQRQSLRQKNEAQLANLHETMLGYWTSHAALPCPTRPNRAGEALLDGNTCLYNHGFVPFATLGVAGATNADALLLDAFGFPIRYTISNRNGINSADGFLDWANRTEVTSINHLSDLKGNISICSDTSCNNSDSIVYTDEAAFVLMSVGIDHNNAASDENSGEIMVNGINQSYGLGNNNDFVWQPYNAQTFDDVLLWGNPYELYMLLINARLW